MGSLKIHIALFCGTSMALAACSTQAPKLPLAPTVDPSQLLTNDESDVITSPPRKVYERVARQAARCWFGPFGSAHNRYIMHAEVPPPNTSAPVTIAIHRRLKNRKKPWGPALMRAELSGRSATTLSYKNLGLEAKTMSRMTRGFNRWANGKTDCARLHDAAPQWAPQAATTPTGTARRR